MPGPDSTTATTAWCSTSRGRAAGYSLNFVEQVLREGNGDALSIAGGAKLNFQLREPAYDPQTGAAIYSHGVGDHVADLNGYRTMRDLVYGGSHEGYTTFGIGVRARLPFRVFTLAGPGTHGCIVVDGAHQWSS